MSDREVCADALPVTGRAGIFFIGYAACEIPSNLLLQRFGARFWIARILIVWGIISVSFMFVSTPIQFLTLRFLLGIAEAGFYPGIVLYLTYWFPAKRRGRRGRAAPGRGSGCRRGCLMMRTP